MTKEERKEQFYLNHPDYRSQSKSRLERLVVAEMNRVKRLKYIKKIVKLRYEQKKTFDEIGKIIKQSRQAIQQTLKRYETRQRNVRGE